VSTTLWMYEGVKVEGVDVTQVLKEVLGWRYRLAPSLYSLYVAGYHRKGWPVLKVCGFLFIYFRPSSLMIGDI